MADEAFITCLRCGNRNSSLVSHCYYCGDRLERICPHCGHDNPPEAKYYCEKCEQPLIAASSEPPSEPSASSELPPELSATASEPSASSEPTPESVVPELGSGVILCPRCQHTNEPASSYCYHCGLPLDEVTVQGSLSTIRAFHQGTPGGFWLRFVANLLDTILVTVAHFVTYELFGEDFAKSFDPDVPFVFADLVNTIVGLLYAPILISLWRTTVGKRPFELYVVKADGGRCSFWRALGRELAKFLSAIILFVGFLMIAFRKDKRGLHDLIAGTVVIKKSESV